MNAAPDAHLFVLLVHLRKACEFARKALVVNIGRDEVFRTATENSFKNTSRSTRIDPRLRWIFRMHRRGVQRLPARVAFGRIVAVLVAVADRGDRPPEVVLEFGIPIDDEAVG